MASREPGFLCEEYLKVLPSQETESFGTYLIVESRGMALTILLRNGSTM
jgi:hypothetical protein